MRLVVLSSALVLPVVLSWVVAWFAASHAVRRGPAVTNYRGRPVPLGLGWAWVAAAALWLAAGVLRVAWSRPATLDASGASVSAPLLVLAVAFLGWLDDRYGTAEARGMRGHVRALAGGRVTTGLAKLVGVPLCSLAAAWFLPVRSSTTGVWSWVAWIAGAVVIAGTANLVNLLDLRPGRALKAYVVLCLLAAVASIPTPLGSPAPLVAALGALAVLPLLAPALAVWRLDLSERGMLGDMGANAAGAAAGFLLAGVLPAYGLVVAALLVTALNLASERVSFSVVIERNGLLRRLDMLGRGGEATDAGARKTEGG